VTPSTVDPEVLAPQNEHQPGEPAPAGESAAGESVADDGRFRVHLAIFEGPFDLLLQLISKHKLDVTEVALSTVTDELIAHIRSHEGAWPLEQATEFLVVAATLLDLKAARLLPSGEVEDEEDLALLEARDLLFARLLQYRAYKQVSTIFAQRMREQGRRFPRAVSMEPRFAGLLPEVLLGLGPDEFAVLAARALAPKPAPPGLSIDHIHAPRVSVREQAAVLVDRLRRQREATFRALVGDAQDTLTVVARVLALRELFREGAVSFEQAAPLQDLLVRWIGDDESTIDVGEEFDVDPDVESDDEVVVAVDVNVDADGGTDLDLDRLVRVDDLNHEHQREERQ
jgi:segregation and condensation protein A